MFKKYLLICCIAALNDGAIYYLDYNENVLKKDGEKTLSGDPFSFINKERAQLKQGEYALYDSLDDKLLILKKLNSGAVQ